MSSFKLAFHSVTGRRIVEVWEGDEFIASIYPDERIPRAIKIISKHDMNVAEDRAFLPGNLHAVHIEIGRGGRN